VYVLLGTRAGFASSTLFLWSVIVGHGVIFPKAISLHSQITFAVSLLGTSFILHSIIFQSDSYSRRMESAFSQLADAAKKDVLTGVFNVKTWHQVSNTLLPADLAEKLRSAIASLSVPIATGEVLRLTASIGVSEVDPTDEHVATCPARADEAMYRAKRGGRNRVVIGQPVVPNGCG
jgi:hypothetical protein